VRLRKKNMEKNRWPVTHVSAGYIILSFSAQQVEYMSDSTKTYHSRGLYGLVDISCDTVHTGSY
jgi:hypothetical protein